MWEDPIVAEVHRARAELAADCNYDLATFFAGVQKRQASLGAGLVPQKRCADAETQNGRRHQSDSTGNTPSEAVSAA